MLKVANSVISASRITGVLPVLNGGTGVTTSTGTGNTVLSATPTLSGDVTLSTGNLVVADTKGIDFSATSGTGTSELLDDYEEGTWTPAFTSLTVVGAASFEGSYTKVGRLLYWKAKVSTTGTTASVANTTFINNLPFPLGPDRPTFIAQAADFVGCNAVGWVASQTQARTPGWSATASDIYLSGCYETT
jgi:hypothetical protein